MRLGRLLELDLEGRISHGWQEVDQVQRHSKRRILLRCELRLTEQQCSSTARNGASAELALTSISSPCLLLNQYAVLAHPVFRASNILAILPQVARVARFRPLIVLKTSCLALGSISGRGIHMHNEPSIMYSLE